jgi:hypothetical protein
MAPLGAVAFSKYIHLPQYIYLFVTFWEVTTGDLTCIHESDNPSMCLSSEEEKRCARRGSVMREKVPQYHACQFVITQAVTNLLGHYLPGAMILWPPTLWETSGFQ